MRVALYLRVSTEDQAARVLPIDGQRDACRAYADARGWSIVAEYIDAGVSGTRTDRPGLDAMIAAARRGELDLVLAFDRSRYSRHVGLSGWLAVEAERAGVRLATVTEAGASELETDIRAVLSAEQLRGLRLATLRGLRAAESRGHRHGSGRMLGFRWSDTRTREIVPDEADLVREIFRRVDAGEQLAEVGRASGLSRDRLLRILRHPAYAGAHVAGRRPGTPGLGTRRRAPRSAWRITWDAHPAIVSRDLWDRVQTRLDGHRAGPPPDGRLALSGLLRCAEDGRRLALVSWSPRADGSRVYRYRCPDCERRISLRGWTALVASRIAQELRSSDLPRRVADALRDAARAGEEIGARDAEIRRLRGARETLLAAVESGELRDPRELLARLRTIEERLDAAERGREAVARAAAREVPTEEEIRRDLARLADALAALDPADPEIDYRARDLLRATVEEVRIDLETGAGELVLHAETPPGSRSRAQERFRFVVPLAA